MLGQNDICQTEKDNTYRPSRVLAWFDVEYFMEYYFRGGSLLFWIEASSGDELTCRPTTNVNVPGTRH